MRIIDGKLYDYDNNIEADIHYDCFKKQITNEYGEIFREKDVVETMGKVGFIFKIYNENTIRVDINRNYIIITTLNSIKHSTKKCKYFNNENRGKNPRSLSNFYSMIQSDLNN